MTTTTAKLMQALDGTREEIEKLHTAALDDDDLELANAYKAILLSLAESLLQSTETGAVLKAPPVCPLCGRWNYHTTECPRWGKAS